MVLPRRVVVEHLWADVVQQVGARGMERVRGALDVWAGVRTLSARLQQEHHLREAAMPGIRTSPWLDPHRFRFARAIERLYPSILRELQSIPARSRRTYFVPYQPRVPGWRRFTFCRRNQRFAATCRHCPTVERLIDRIQRENAWIEQLMFISLDPGTVLEPHTDRHNYLASLHLGLVTPAGAVLEVAGRRRVPRAGRLFAFDNSFLHSAWNDGSSPRILLALHTFHPDLTPKERRVMAMLHDFMYRYQEQARREASGS